MPTLGPPAAIAGPPGTVRVESAQFAATGSSAATDPVAGGSTVIGWGNDYSGSVGTGDTSFDAGDWAVTRPTPVAVTPALAGRTVTKVKAAGNSGTCALADGDLVCWEYRRTPALDDAAGLPGPGSITDFDRNGEVTCVVSGGRAYCRGANYRGQLGNNSVVASSEFVPVWDKGVLSGRTIQAISVGGQSVCARADGRIFCWGYNYFGQLGNGASGDDADSLVPIAVDTSGALNGLTIDQVFAGSRGACARAQHDVYCWGEETILGVERAAPYFRDVPGKVDTTGELAGKTITDLQLQGETACVLADGAPYCWGSGAPEWGIGTVNVNWYLPVALRSPDLVGKTATHLMIGGTSCVLADGSPVCWGDNTAGGLGVGDTERIERPVATYTGGALAGRTIVGLGGGGGVTAGFAITAEPPGQATAAGTFTTIAPARVADTRPGAGGRGAIAGGGQLEVQVTGTNGIPAHAAAVSVNLTVTEPVGAGYLTVGAPGATPPTVSTLNFVAGQTVANKAVATVSDSGAILVRNGSPAPAQVIVDVTGYYLGGGAATPGSYRTVTPSRLLDTRVGVGAPAGPTRPGGTVSLPVTRRAGIPTGGAAAAVLNLTATNPTASGYITAYAGGTPAPQTSNLNFDAAATVATLAVVPIGADGSITLFNGSATGRVDLLADVVGYYLAGTPTAAGAYVPITPTRLVDSRIALGLNGPVPARGSAEFQVGGHASIPRWAAPTAAVNLTVVGPAAGGYATVQGAAVTGPARTSTLNFTPGRTVANNADTPSNSRILNGSAAGLHVIVDVFGYFHN